MYRLQHLVFLFCLCLLCTAGSGRADSLTRWLDQSIYVPIYSHIYADERYKDKPFSLTATLSIRNIDPDNALVLQTVDYYDSEGQLLQSYINKPVTIGPLGSTRYIIPETEDRGGSGAKFLVRWSTDKGIIAPIVESIMIGTKMQQGISFISRGRVIRGTTPK